MLDWNICYWVDYSNLWATIYTTTAEEEESIIQWLALFSITTNKVELWYQFKKEIVSEEERYYLIWQFNTKQPDFSEIRFNISESAIDMLSDWYMIIVDWVDIYLDNN